MKHYALLISALVMAVCLLFVCSACGGTEVGLGKEFSLAIGQKAVVSGENLEVVFEQVTEDSRCPEGAECITEGSVTCLVGITEGEASYRIELVQPDLYLGYTQDTYKGYRFTFKIEPYPQAGREISSKDYRLLLTVGK